MTPQQKLIHLSEEHIKTGTIKRVKTMPQKLLRLFKETSIPQFAVPPITGLSTWFGLLKFQGANIDATTSTQIGVAVVIVTLLTGIVTGVVKLKLGTKELDITQDTNTTTFSVKMMSVLNDALKDKDTFLQTTIKERDEFWSKRIDFLREQFKEDMADKEVHWDKKLEMIRDEKHLLSNQCTGIRIKYGALRSLIETRGHMVRESDQDINIIWNEKG
jgi:hypothetical protein